MRQYWYRCEKSNFESKQEIWAHHCPGIGGYCVDNPVYLFSEGTRCKRSCLADCLSSDHAPQRVRIPDFNRLGALGPVKLRDLFDADRTRRDYDQSGRNIPNENLRRAHWAMGVWRRHYMANFSQLERVSWNELYRCCGEDQTIEFGSCD